MNITEWKQAGKQYRYRNYNLFYRDEGQGEVIVCIHGFPTSSWDWHKIWSQLVKHYRVICIDMIGFGFSDKPLNYSYSILDQADLHEAWFSHLGIKSAHILAHDYGDTVAQELLARFEDRQGDTASQAQPGLHINSLCFLNGGLFPETHRALLVQKLLISPIGGLISRLSSEAIVRKRLNSVFGPDTQMSEDEWQEFWLLIRYNEGTRISHKLIRYMAERKKYRERWVGVMPQTTVPIRLIDGMLDPISGAHMVARYREIMPDSVTDIVCLDHVGHYPQVEDAQAVLDSYLAFISPLAT